MSGAKDEKTMPFLQHLAELRSCVLHAFAGIGIMTSLCLYWAGDIFGYFTGPLASYFPNAKLIGTGPAEAFIVKLKVAFFCGMLFSSPYSFYQLWRFISPGLHEKERRIAVPFVAGSTICFLSGISFCFYAVFPFAFQFFSEEFLSLGVLPTIRIGEYLSFALKLLFVFGLAFELPVLSFFLSRMRLITHQWLLKQFRYAVVVIFVLAAVLTPGPDVITQLLLAGPLLLLYGLCIAIAFYFAPAEPARGSALVPARPQAAQNESSGS